MLRTMTWMLGVALFLSTSAWSAETAPPSGDSKIIPPGAKLEQLWDKGEFTEGVAVAPEGAIYFSDIPHDPKPGKVVKYDPRTGESKYFCVDSGKSNGLMFDRHGRLIAACGANFGKQALCEITADGHVKVLVEKYRGKKFNAPNDLVIHPNGSIYFSDPRYVGPEPLELDQMSVYRYDPDGSLHRVTTEKEIQKPNGVILSPDGKTLYVAETNNGTTNIEPGKEATPGRMTLNEFPIREDGSLGPKRVLVDYGKELGVDGMTVDKQGNIYAAVRSAKRHGIIVYSPQGKERAYIPTEELPTNCCFGRGEDAKTLYVTVGTGLYRIRLNIEGHHPATAE